MISDIFNGYMSLTNRTYITYVGRLIPHVRRSISMAAEAICDACGRREPMHASRRGDWLKPSLWYQRTDDDGTQLVCSRECVERLARVTGKTNVVLPI